LCLRETRPNRRPDIQILEPGQPLGHAFGMAPLPPPLPSSSCCCSPDGSIDSSRRSSTTCAWRTGASRRRSNPPPTAPDRRPATPPGREMQSRQPAPPCFPRRNRHGHHPVLVSPAINKIGQMPPFITLNDVWVSTKAKKGKIRLTAAKPYRQIVNNSSRIGHLAQ